MSNAASAMGGEHARKIVQRVNDLVAERGAAMGRAWGAPLGSEPLPRAEIARLWHLQGPAMRTPEGQAQIAALVQSGQHAQALSLAYPYREALLGKGRPMRRVERAQQLADLAERETQKQQEQALAQALAPFTGPLSAEPAVEDGLA